jgi:1-deoxy-D-xylulose-5-phosphate synthase
VLVHCVTRKGYGYAPAENHQDDHMHGGGAFDPETGQPLSKGGSSWSKVFAEEMVRLGAERDDLVAITAAMQNPVGFGPFAAAYPRRCFDVGIAEQHALTSAAGMAAAGLHPVVALYATFLNRAFDQLLMDVALHKAGVTLVLDRAGVTGEDGASHHGMWDLALLGIVPGLHLAAPRDAATLRAGLIDCLAIADAPSVLRYPKTPLGPDIPALRTEAGVDVLAEQAGSAGRAVDVLLVSVGAMAGDVLTAGQRVAEAGYTVRVVDPRWVTPVPPGLLGLARAAGAVVTVEDGVVVNGAGARFTQFLRDGGCGVPTKEIGIPVAFLAHGTVGEIRADIGLTPQGISRRTVEFAAAVLGRGEPAGNGSSLSGAPELSATDERRD